MKGTEETALLLRHDYSSFTAATLDAQIKLMGAAESSAEENLLLRVRFGKNSHIYSD